MAQLVPQLTALVATSDDALAGSEEMAMANLQFQTRIARNSNEVLQSVATVKPDILILDYSLPEIGGPELCRRLRAVPGTTDLPIIMLTPDTNGEEKIQSLEAGADTCISRTAPSKMLEAHVRALRRRANIEAGHNHIRAGPIEMDIGRWTVTVTGKPLELTKIEFSLLRALLEAKGRALTRDFLLQNVWAHGTIHGLDTRTVDVHVGRLRRKLGVAGHYIITVRNVGFRFDLLPEWLASHHAS